MGPTLLILLSTVTLSSLASQSAFNWQEIQSRLTSHRQLQSLCGPLSAFRIAALHQKHFSTDRILANHSVSSQGIPLRDVIGILEQLGISARAVRCHNKQLTSLTLPCILVTHKHQHCLVLESIDHRQQIAHIWEPSTMRKSQISLSRLEELWSQMAILFPTNPTITDRLSDLSLAIMTASLMMIAIRWAPSHQALLCFANKVSKIGFQMATIFAR